VHTILIFSGKGGAGKTTVARELAVAGGLAGRNVALVDLDPQAGMTGWFGRREADTPVMVKLSQATGCGFPRAAEFGCKPPRSWIFCRCRRIG
jgi:cellulose biosynthesis protein BcsQ